MNNSIEQSPTQKFTNLSVIYDEIIKQKDLHFDLYTQLLSINNRNIYIQDNFIISVLKRSLDLSDALLKMIDKWHFTISGAILRMQLDNLLRLHYITIRNDAEFHKEFSSGKSFKDINHLDGNKLTDFLLISLAKDKYPWIQKVYKETSKFIHLSNKHSLAMITDMNPLERSEETFFGVGFPHWPEKSIVEILEAFYSATDALLDIVKDWIVEKSNLSDFQSSQSHMDDSTET